MALSILKQTILAGLLDIRDNGPENNILGICSNLQNYVYCNLKTEKFEGDYETGQWLKSMFPIWPKYSGDVFYPVPAPKHARKEAERMYSDSNNLWKFQYGALRYELVDFLIVQLVEEDRKV